MITLRKASERGHANHGWLDSHHTFSFADYYDAAHGLPHPARHQRRPGRAGQGFGTHGHRDMEIVSYVLEGELAHQDSMGNGRGAPTRRDPPRRRAAHERRHAA